MYNTPINKAVIAKVAKALGDLNANVVFVGGAVVSLYIDDPAAEDIRPTMDIDLVAEIATIDSLEKLREELTRKGFRQSSQHNITCRFSFEDVIVDVMATKDIGWAPGNQWFELGFHLSIPHPIGEYTIRILPLPAFLATKFSAFWNRGAHDVYASSDFEDITYLFNHTGSLLNQVQIADPLIKNFLINSAQEILKTRKLLDAMKSHLFHEDQEQRFQLVKGRLTQLAQLTPS
jgi:predicted nucleotidyltransferase